MAKFFFFEYIAQMFYSYVFTAPKETYGKPTQLGVTFALDTSLVSFAPLSPTLPTPSIP